MEIVPFDKTGLKPFNFVRDDVMLVQEEEDAVLCYNICKLNPRCDAAEISNTECTLYHNPSGTHPELRPQKGVRTVFVSDFPQKGLTKAEILRSIGDPADHSSGDESSTPLPPLPNVFLRVWDQRSETEGYAENLRDDGLYPEHEYFLTLEGEGAKGDVTVAVKWNESRAKNVSVHRKANEMGRLVPVRAITHITFTANGFGYLNEAVWLEDSGGRRSLPYRNSSVDYENKGAPLATLTTFKKNTLDVQTYAASSPENYSYGQIVYDGWIAHRDTHDRMPQAMKVLQALQLDGVQVTKSGSMFAWRPISIRDKKVTFKAAETGPPYKIIKDLALPGLGEDSDVVVYAGRFEDDLVPLARVVSKSRREAIMPPPAPAKYDAWFVTADDLSSAEGKTVAVENPDPNKCARECDVANEDGNATCTVFRVSDGGCDLFSWEPDAVKNARWSSETAGTVFRRIST